MIDNANQHLPSPEFRASLERDVMQAFRRQSQFDAPPSMARRSRIRTAAALAIGLAVGIGGAVATAQVQNSQQRDSLLQIAEMNRRLAAMRLEIAYAEAQSTANGVSAGVKSRADAIGRRESAALLEMDLERLDWDIAEIRATGQPVRNELWAPKVGKEDFVTARLHVDRDFASWQNGRMKFAAEETAQRVRVGLAMPSDSLRANRAVKASMAEIMFVWNKQQLRDQFVANKLTEQQVAQRLRILESLRSLENLADNMNEASDRAKRTKELHLIGKATLLDVKRAEVDSMQAAFELERARQQQGQLKSVMENKSPARARKDSSFRQ